MNKIFKKLCGTLCMGVAVLGIGSVSAATTTTSRIELGLPNSTIEINQKGDFSTTITATKVTSDTCQMGVNDVNKDSKVTADDALTILKYISGTIENGINDEGNIEEFKYNADTDCDGAITDVDAENILKKIVGIEIATGTTSTTSKSVLNAQEIEYVKYAVINGDNNIYKKYLETITKIKQFTSVTDDNVAEINRLIEAKYELEKSLKSQLITSNDNKTINGNVGTTKTDVIYVYIEVKAKTGETGNGVLQIDTSKIGWDSYLKGLNNKTTTETKVEEGTVKNPETAVTISIVGGIVALGICAIASKKKNKFNRI